LTNPLQKCYNAIDNEPKSTFVEVIVLRRQKNGSKSPKNGKCYDNRIAFCEGCKNGFYIHTTLERKVDGMNFIISANTDIGIVKSTNQDSLTVKTINTAIGRMSFAVLCDGMGGLAMGEVASASVIRAFDSWVHNDLPQLCNAPLDGEVIKAQWEKILLDQNTAIKAYGGRLGVRLGTTAVVMLLTECAYYVMNVGDSRAYEITDHLQQITTDQTFVAREVALGNMTPEQAEVDERRSVLLQCIGASEEVYPDFFTGATVQNAVYMLCSDGFRHEITPDEIFAKFQPGVLLDDASMNRNTVELIELNKQRNERDNISVVLVRTY